MSDEGVNTFLQGTTTRAIGFGRVVEEDNPILISNGSCVSIAIRLKQLKSSVSTCPFQIQHSIFETDELHPPANERRLFVEGKAGGHKGW